MLPPGWATDIAVLEHTGSTIERHSDHLVLRTPAIPTFHWGNCLLVLDGSAVDDARRWTETFHRAFPEAGWVAIGLPRLPDDPSAWAVEGLELELDDVLTTRTLPAQTPLAPGYTVRRIRGDDWEQVIARAQAESARTGEYEAAGYERFLRDRTAARRDMCARGAAAFFGAFAGDTLVADLGIVRCGVQARYQDVGTDEQHRGRGLASHLLGVAARWAGERGCTQWVIVTEATNAAGRVYRRVGFEPDVSSASAYRRPPR